MQDRIEEIYREKAMMGLGKGGCMNSYIYPSGMGMEFEGNVGGVLVGGARRKLSAYNRFVKAFLSKPANKRKYRNQKALFKAAAAAWRKSGRAAPKRRKRYGSKTAKRSYTRKRRVGRPRTRRARGRGFEDDYDFEGDGVLVGGAKYKPGKAQLDNLGLTESEFYKMLDKEDPRAKRPKLFNDYRAHRVGKRYKAKTRRGDCFYQNDEGPYWIDSDYQCVDWKKVSKSAILEALEKLSPEDQQTFVDNLTKKNI